MDSPHSRPGEVVLAVKDAFLRGDPAVSSTIGTTAFPGPSQPECTLVFHPPIERQLSYSSVTTTTSTVSGSHPRLSKDTIDPLRVFSDTPSTSTGGRRGSLMPTSTGSLFNRSRRGPAPTTAASRMSPTTEMLPLGSNNPSTKVTTGSASRGVMPGRQDSGRSVHVPSGDRAKEDMVMAKWRQWIIEQPVPVNGSDSSLTRSRKETPSLKTPTMVPMVPMSPLSPLASNSSSMQSLRPPQRVQSSTRTDSSDSQPSLVSRMATNGVDHGYEMFATESTQALRDVELAVDEDLLAAATANAHNEPRRMSFNPRISPEANPFIDLAGRLSSRRVRPLVLELIQALGHYVDAIWCVRYPDIPCPWICTETPGTLSTWSSRMITAVQEGKKTEHVADPPTGRDVAFWKQETVHAIRDVDEVVGIYKGVRWAFTTALNEGQYGSVDDDNVIGKHAEGGNMARILNDLEEALWGDAPPRPTDLAWDLPIDFDPFAVSDSIISTGPLGHQSGLAAFFSDGSAAAAKATSSMPVTDDIYNVSLPDMQTDTIQDTAVEANQTDSPSSPKNATAPSRHGSASTDAHLNLDAFRIEGEQVTLEEIGKRRHQDWLAGRQK